jgi:hypothetical protein
VSTDGRALTRVLVPLLIGLGVWILLACELAIMSPREMARRHATFELCVMAQIAAMWIAALVLAQREASADGVSASTIHDADLSAALLWAGNFWWFVRNLQRPLCQKWLPSLFLPIERYAVCANTVRSL